MNCSLLEDLISSSKIILQLLYIYIIYILLFVFEDLYYIFQFGKYVSYFIKGWLIGRQKIRCRERVYTSI